MAMAKPLPPISVIHCIQNDAAFSIRQLKMLCKENPCGNTEQSLKQKPDKSSNVEVRKPTGLWDVGAAVEETKKNPTVGFGQPFHNLLFFLVCLLINLFHLVRLTIVIYVPVFFEALLASPPFNLSCHVILFSKVCHTARWAQMFALL